MARFHLKRIYDPVSGDDGRRILVERLWPRGVRKADAGLDEWLREIAPSTELRRWFGHDPDKWPEFQRRYRQELAGHPDLLARLQAYADEDPVTLLFAARDTERNSAVVLKAVLDEGAGRAREPSE